MLMPRTLLAIAVLVLASPALADDVETLPLAPPTDRPASVPAPEPSDIDETLAAPPSPALKAGPNCDWSADAGLCQRAWEEAEAARREKHEARPRPKPRQPSPAEALIDDLPLPIARGEKPGATAKWQGGGPRVGWKWKLD